MHVYLIAQSTRKASMDGCFSWNRRKNSLICWRRSVENKRNRK